MERKACRTNNEKTQQFLRRYLGIPEDRQATASQEWKKDLLAPCWRGGLACRQRHQRLHVRSTQADLGAGSGLQWRRFPGTTKAPTTTSARVLPARPGNPVPADRRPPQRRRGPRHPSGRALCPRPHTEQGPLLSPTPPYCSSCARLQVSGRARERPGALPTADRLPAARPSARHVVFPSPRQPRRLRLPAPAGAAQAQCSRPAGGGEVTQAQRARRGASRLNGPASVREERCACSVVGGAAGVCRPAGPCPAAEAPAPRRRPFGPRSVWRRPFGSAPPPASWVAGSGSSPRAPRACLPWERGVEPYVGKGLMRAALAPHRRALRQPSGGIGGPGLRQSLAGWRLVRQLGLWGAPAGRSRSSVISWSLVVPACRCRLELRGLRFWAA